MGLFDGASGRGELASTAHVAKLLDAPVLLVIDAASMARSAAAIVHGYRTFDPDVDIAGVIVNKVGSENHVALLREAIEPLGVPVVGALRRDDRVEAPERHLGLVPAGEREARTRASIEALGEAVLAHVDLDAVLALARSAPPLTGETWSPAPRDPLAFPSCLAVSSPGLDTARHPAKDPPHAAGLSATIAIARGSAFSFHYEENLELLEAAGATLAPFDPTRDTALPEGAGALILAGGFPEIFGAELSANAPLREQVAAFARAGRPVLAECGGPALPLRDARRPADVRRAARPRPDGGTAVDRLPRGGRAGRLDAVARRRGGARARVSLLRRRGRQAPGLGADRARDDPAEGYVAGGVHASYMHVHWAAFPHAARRLVAAAAREPTWA